MNTEGIVIQKTEMGKLIGAGKRVWTGDKTTRISTDKIDRNESALFTNDLRLARLAKQKKLLDDEIIDHIDEVLIEHRGYDKDDLQLKKEAALLDLLKDCYEVLCNDPTYPGVSERLGNMINELEGE